ncbi:MAG: chromate transporter, partial [Oscillospiraceae bacterium]
MNLLLTACLSFLKVGAFSFGGGYAVLAFIQKEAVEKFGWIS